MRPSTTEFVSVTRSTISQRDFEPGSVDWPISFPHLDPLLLGRTSSEKLEDQAGASLFLRREILVAVEGSLGERIRRISTFEGVPVFRIAAPLGDAKAVHQLGSLFHCFWYITFPVASSMGISLVGYK